MMTLPVKTGPLLVLFAFLMLAVLALGGCANTVDGVGRDIERAGKSIQRAF